MISVVTKGVEIATKRVIALKKLITHNPRDGVCPLSFPAEENGLMSGIGNDCSRDQNHQIPESPQYRRDYRYGRRAW
jgi:hypothetical protein